MFFNMVLDGPTALSHIDLPAYAGDAVDIWNS